MAKIKVTCPHCNKTYELPVRDEYVGKMVKIKCINKDCRMEFKMKLAETKAADDERTFINETVGVQFLKLEVLPDENAKAQSFMISQEYTVVGKKNNSGPEYKPDVEIVTTDRYMSRKHCVIQRVGQKKYTIKDNGAKNGTWLNGKLLTDMEVLYLNNGDELKIGRTFLKVNLVGIGSNKPKNSEDTMVDDDETTI